MVAGEKDPLRAQTPRRRHGQRRMHAEAPGFVGGGRYHAPVAQSADDDRLAAIFRLIPLLYRSEKGIHVDMDDPTRHFNDPLYFV